MIIEKVDLREYHNCLKDQAFTLKKSRGRRKNDYLDPDMEGYEGIINPWRLDYEAILESKAIRRLRFKTQVFPTPKNFHIRTRDIHTLEVVSLSRKLASILGLNVDLCEAIALGHDLGHPPFGHVGEKTLTQLNNGKYFHHSIYSVVVAQRFERRGQGLNLVHETSSGIQNHTESKEEIVSEDNLPAEFLVVKRADKISYVFSDSNDIKRFDFLDTFAKKELQEKLDYFGGLQRSRIRSCINALVKETARKGKISFELSETAVKFMELKDWLYENVYRKIPRKIYIDIIESLYENLEAMFGVNPTNHIALMTDKEAVYLYNKMLEKPRLKIENLRNLSFMEVINSVDNPNKIDFSDPDLSWGNT